jgi:hypothetical protein
VNKWISDLPSYYHLLEKVYGLMMQLCNLKNIARLQVLTDRCTITKNVRRWPLKYDMAIRYIELEPHINKNQEIEDIVPTNCECQDLANLMIPLSKFQSITNICRCMDAPHSWFVRFIIENVYPFQK